MGEGQHGNTHDVANAAAHRPAGEQEARDEAVRVELERQRAIEKAGGEGAEHLRREKEEIAAALVQAKLKGE